MALIKDFSKIAGSSFVNMFIGLITTPIITRMVEPEQYGNWSLFNIYSHVSATILLLGTDYIIVRYYYNYEDKAYKKQLVRWCLLVTTVAILIACAPIIVSVKYIRPNWGWFILCLLIINIWSNVINRLVNLLLRFENKINVLSITTILHKVFFVAIAIAALFFIGKREFELLSIATVFSTSIIIIVCIYFIRDLFIKGKNDAEYKFNKKDMLSYGFPLMISGCAYILFQATDKLVIGKFCSEADLGIYSSAASFLSIFAILQSSFTTIWWPAAMKNFERNPENKSLYIKANDLLCFAMVIMGLTFILSKDLIILLLGEHFRSAVVILPFVIFQPILYTLSETTVVGLNFQKKSKVQLLITTSSLIFNVVINVFLTKNYGIRGTSIAVGLSYIFFLTLRSILSYHFFKVEYHFAKMYVSVIILFAFALIHTLFPGKVGSSLIVILFYLIICIMYRDVIRYGKGKLQFVMRRINKK